MMPPLREAKGNTDKYLASDPPADQQPNPHSTELSPI